MNTKKLFEIYQAIWHHIKEHLQDISNSNADEWWDEENASSHKILVMTDNEPEYIKKFTLALLTAEWELLHAIYRERSGNDDSNRANGDIQQQ